MPTATNLCAYRNSALKVKGECSITIQVGTTVKHDLRLLMVDSQYGSNLFA